MILEKRNVTMSYLILIVFVDVICGVSSTGSSTINGIFSSRNLAPHSVGFNSAVAESVVRSAQIAINHCQSIFKWDRWNCPESAFVRRQKSQPATKEIAFVHAILVASIVHTVTRNCSQGNIEGCECSPRIENMSFSHGRESKMFSFDAASKETPIEWRWGGCSDNVEYGEQIAGTLLDQPEKGKDVHAYIHLHNNRVGKRVVRESMVRKCRCHGVSGSCTMQICWMQLAPFSEIAERLRKMYDAAERIDYDSNLGNSAGASGIAERILSDKPYSLTYTKKSPNYCWPNTITGWNGTKGRLCSRSKSEHVSLLERRSCRTLCHSCGHRVRKQKKEIVKQCNCKFKWCCEVKCDVCKESVEEFFCD